MKNLRQAHLYIGVFFAPLLIYFAISGMWQLFGFHDLPRHETPTKSQIIFHAFSNPHKDATVPFGDPHKNRSVLFQIFSLLMAVGFVITTVLGIQMALLMGKKRKAVIVCLAIGTLAPLIFLVVHS